MLRDVFHSLCSYSYIIYLPAFVCANSNLGNTCFMNSILQCMNATQCMTAYMLDCNENSPTGWKLDINEENVLGHGGNLARAYADLAAEFYSNQYTCVAPKAFKVCQKMYQLQQCTHARNAYNKCAHTRTHAHSCIPEVPATPVCILCCGADVDHWFCSISLDLLFSVLAGRYQQGGATVFRIFAARFSGVAELPIGRTP